MNLWIFLKKLNNEVIVKRIITIMKDDQPEVRPRGRKHTMRRTTVGHGIDKETSSLKCPWGPVLLNKALPFEGTARFNPDILLRSLLPVQDGIVAQRLEELSCHRENGALWDGQALDIVRPWRPRLTPFHLWRKPFNQSEIVLLRRAAGLRTAEDESRSRLKGHQHQNWIGLE
jgi:hypothetical protein